MKITATQLRQIIKEEVQKTLRTQTSRKRSLRESPEMEFPEMEAHIEIPDVTGLAKTMGRPLKRFISFVMELGSKYPSVRFESPLSDDPSPYSREYDTLSAIGSLAELESLARELDKKIRESIEKKMEKEMGGAQSINIDEFVPESLVNAIQSHY